MILNDYSILIAGGYGLLGSALRSKLDSIGAKYIAPRKESFDLTNQDEAFKLIKYYKPEIVFNLAVEFGGIVGNAKHPGRFFYSNMSMCLNLIEASRVYGVNKFIQMGTQCSYSNSLTVPFKEEDLWNGYPEDNNAPYGIAKRAISTMIKSYNKEYGFNGIYLIPCNMYGENDNFHPIASHVIPGLIRKIIEAKESSKEFVELWGSGKATREFLYTRDAAEAIVKAAELYNKPDPINLGTGNEVTISELANLIANIVDYKGKIIYSNNGIDGQMRRCNDVSKAKKEFGFVATTSLKDGLVNTIEWFKRNRNNIRELVYL